MKYRTPSMREELYVWRQLAHQLHTHRCITLNQVEVIEILDRILAWSSSFNDANGERSGREISRNINRAFWEKLAETPEKGIK